MTMKDIEGCIREGLQKAYYSLIGSSEIGSLRSKVIEYLFTVFIFNELVETIKPRKYAISLEYPASFFYENAFNVFPFGSGAAKSDIEQNPPPPPPDSDFKNFENGRIDIGITKMLATVHLKKKNRFIERSISGIEVKGINPNSNLLLADYNRLAICLLSDNRKNDENSILGCFIGYVKRIGGEKTVTTKQKVEKALISLKASQNAIFKKSKYFHQLETSIEVFDIYSLNDDDYKDQLPEEYWEYGDAARETGAIFGIIVKLQRKNTQNS